MKRIMWGWAASAVLAAGGLAGPASAYLFWNQPKLQGQPVNGDEPGIAMPLAGLTPKEVKANMLWSMRAGLNVAALQCQFAPALQTVANYNALLKQHAGELGDAYKTMTAYFRRTSPKTWQTELDQYTTRTYNSFSTFKAQYEFCDTAASIGRTAVDDAPGKQVLTALAAERMREFRNSLAPMGDMGLAYRTDIPTITPPDVGCLDKKGRPAPCKKKKD